MATLALNSGLWVRRLLIGGSPLSGAVPRLKGYRWDLSRQTSPPQVSHALGLSVGPGNAPEVSVATEIPLVILFWIALSSVPTLVMF